ncbi:MAG: hypothetical protein ACD_46C00570G0002 [uncultured bacterium]|nr:MAG: hypothetical protein ACD_46C00570G0002 [uncultured bacterium]
MEQKNEVIYTVSQLNNEVKFILEDTFPFVWVEGEISNFAAPHSGHFYFSLKDSSAQVRCAMFRSNHRHLNFSPKDGLHVLAKARVSLYENRGEYQLIVEALEERGEGKLRRAFEVLKKKLDTAGLFSAAHKKSIPSHPNQIGVITSPTGAAIRDILTVLKRRYPCVPVIIYPTLVQGNTAAPTIAAAIETANRRNECDVLILARGGGSLEDLWPFNEEIVAHAIFNSHLPMISGIGHEVDFTIADFVADVRAPTPSAAAEIAAPDAAEISQKLNRQESRLVRLIQNKLLSVKQHLDWSQKHLLQQHPKRKLLEKVQQLDFYELTLTKLQQQYLNKLCVRTQEYATTLLFLSPTQKITSTQNQTQLLNQQLKNLISIQLDHSKNSMTTLAAKLNTLSPLATLQRGYTIASDKNQHILRDANEVNIGDKIHLQLAKGKLDCVVEKLEKKLSS